MPSARKSYAPRFAPWGLALLLSGLAAGLAHLCFTPYYQTNDDIATDMLLRGMVITSKPTSFILSSHVLFADFVRWLYRVFPQIPCWRLACIALQLCATTVLGYLVLSRGMSWGRVGLWLWYLVSVDTYFYVRPQFTATAFLTAQTGSLLCLAPATIPQISLRLRSTLATVFVTAGSMVRSDCALLCLLLAVPGVILQAILAYRAGIRPDRLRCVLRDWGLPWSLAAAGVIVGCVYNHWAYARERGYVEFLAFNTARANFMDYGRVRFTRDSLPVFSAEGWSANDFYMLKQWFFLDSDVYSTEKLNAIAAKFGISRIDVESRLQDLVRILTDAWLPFVLALAVVAAFWMRRTMFLVWLTTVVALAFGAGILMWSFHLPPRVYQPLAGFIAAAALVWGASAPKFATAFKRSSYITVGVLLGVVSGGGAWSRIVNEQAFIGRRAGELRQFLLQLDPQPDELYVVWGEAFPFELIPATSDYGILRKLNVFWLCASSRTPAADERLAEFGIDDLYRALYERPDVFIFSIPSQHILFARYVQEHYGPILAVRKVLGLRGPDGRSWLTLWKFARAMDGQPIHPILHHSIHVQSLDSKSPRGTHEEAGPSPETNDDSE